MKIFNKMERNTYDYKDVYANTLEFFNGDELATNVWISKYALKKIEDTKEFNEVSPDAITYFEQSPKDMFHRLTSELYRAGLKYDNPMTYDEIFELIDNFKYVVPQGRPMAGIGNNDTITSISNCFVVSYPEQDSYSTICRVDQEIAQISKRGGGIGTDLSGYRPSNAKVNNAAMTSTGPVEICANRFSSTIREVGQNGRRGALMLSMDINHPDAEKFIDAKMEDGKITGANISLKLSDLWLNSFINNPEPNIENERIWKKIIHNAWKCLDGETKLNIIDNRTNITRLAEMSEIYEDGIDGADYSIYSLNLKTNKIERKNIIAYQKYKNNSEIFEIKTKFGNNIKGTEDHKVYKLNSYGIEPVELKDIKIGDYLVSSNKTEEENCFGKDYVELDFTNENFHSGSVGLNNINDYDKNFRQINDIVGKYGKGYKLTEYKRANRIPILVYKSINNLLSDDLYFVPNTNNNENLKISKNFIISCNLSRFFGLWVADGSFHGNSVLIHANKNEIGFYTEIFNEVCNTFNCKYSIDNVKGDYSEITFNSSFLAQLMKSIGFGYNENGKIIPEFVYSLTSRLKSEFIGGLFDGDGTVDFKGNSISLSQSNYELLSNVKILLQTLGVRSKINKGWLKNDIKFKTIKINYKLSINDKWILIFKNKIGFKILNKQNKINTTFISKNGLPCDPFKNEFKRLKINYQVSSTIRISNEKLSRLLDSKQNTFLNNLISDDLFYDEVIEINKSNDLNYVYDITVEDNHTFLLANGILSSNCAEPGILFWDTILRESIPDCYEKFGFKTLSTNPCGEIPLSNKDSCRLMCFNLYSYVKNPFTERAELDFELLKNHAKKMVKLMDNMIDLEIEKIESIIAKVESDPEDAETKAIELGLWKEIKNVAILGRRAGIGVTAEGDMIAAMGLKYGTPEATKFAAEVHRILSTNVYIGSCDLVQKDNREPFGCFDWELEKNNPYIQRIISGDDSDSKELKSKIEHGRRNIALLTIAPAGTVSLMTQSTSGIEPLFKLYYNRKRKIDKNSQIKPDFIDDTGDWFQEYNVIHPKLFIWYSVKNNISIKEAITELSQKKHEELDQIFISSPYHGATSADIDWVEKVRMQGAVQQYVDHSISATTNIPEETSEDIVRQIYETAWRSGCKGMTIYREGSRDGIMTSTKKSKETQIYDSKVKKRPKSVKGKVVRFNNVGEKWVSVVGMIDDEPYEIFTGLLDKLNIPKYVEEGFIVKEKEIKLILDDNNQEVETPVSRYDFQYKNKEGDIITVIGLSKIFKEEYWNYAKLISGLLRNKMPIQYVVKTIESLNLNTDNINTWKNGVIRTLKKFIKDGTATGDICPKCGGKIIRKDGCMQCSECGWSKCS